MMSLNASLRRLLQERLFTAINIAGLGVGIACFVLIALYLRNELNYESHFSKADRIYRIAVTVQPPDGSAPIEIASNAPQVAPLMARDFPEVEAAARLATWRPAIEVGDNEPMYVSALLADAALFDLFDFRWLAGSAASALQNPDSVVLTAGTAQRLFGSVDVLGRTVTLADQQEARVTGVLANPPATTHLQFEMLAPISMATLAYSSRVLDNWFTPIFHTYVLLKPGASIDSVLQQAPGMVARHLDQEAAGVFLQQAMPLRDIHLQSNRRGELSTPGSRVAVSAAAAIAIVVLMMACVNFTTLSTARAARRAREVGVRKAIGAHRGELVLQFLGEALLMTALAATVGVMLVELALPAFNTLVQKQLTFDLANAADALPLLALTLLVGVAAGIYPAFYLSSHRATAVLRGLVTGGRKGLWLRNALVLVQFSAAIALLICTVTLYRQMDFVRQQDAGYERDQVVVLGNLGPEGVGLQWDAMKRELQAIPGVAQVTAADNAPTQVITRSYFINYEGGAERRSMTAMLADTGFLDTFGIELVAGQDWTPGLKSYLISVEAARELGWTPQEALGKWIEPSCCGLQRAPVSGVVQDVQYGSVHASTGPVLYAIPGEPGEVVDGENRLGLDSIAIKLSGGDLPATLAAIDRVWQRFRPSQPITRSFLDEQFNALYQAEERQGRMLAAFAVLAFLITCLGLYGLATFNAQRRTKEIGVRKVMGGSVLRIVMLLTNDFSKLVLLSNLIAWPLAYFAMERWLQNFAYRIDLTPLVFIGSGLIALCIAWVTVGGTAAKAAAQKPVLALRYE